MMGVKWRNYFVVLFIAAVGCASFSINYKYIFEHFSNGGYLLDSGWFAHLFASGDVLLQNPKSIGNFSYYNIHITPYLSAVSALFNLLHFDNFTAFALHQGFSFALLAVSICGLVIPRSNGILSLILLSAAAVFSITGGMVLQVAEYPHFEQATLAFCGAGAFLTGRAKYKSAAVAYCIACLVREDGGLFVALFLMGGAIVRWNFGDPRDLARSKEFWFFVPALVFGVAAFAIKGRYFNEFPTFTGNFSGDNWSHLGVDMVLDRLRAVLSSPQIFLTLIAVGLLALFSLNYLVFLVLVSPLIIGHLLAVRDVIALFEIYYVVPWMVVWLGIFIVAGIRSQAGRVRLMETSVILMMAVLSSSPILALFGQSNSLWVMWPPRETVDLTALSGDLEKAITSSDRACASLGVVGVVPNIVERQQVIEPGSDLGACGTIFLFNGDLHYVELMPEILGAGYQRTGSVGERTEIYTIVPVAQ